MAVRSRIQPPAAARVLPTNDVDPRDQDGGGVPRNGLSIGLGPVLFLIDFLRRADGPPVKRMINRGL